SLEARGGGRPRDPPEGTLEAGFGFQATHEAEFGEDERFVNPFAKHGRRLHPGLRCKGATMATVNMAEPQTLDTIVVGGGVGGLSAALRLAGAGARVAVLERGPEVGGKMR